MGLTLQEEGPLAFHVGGYYYEAWTRWGEDRLWVSCVFSTGTDRTGPDGEGCHRDVRGNEAEQGRETWVAKWGATAIGGASTIYFDEDFMMGSNDKSLHSHIWGLDDVLPGHICFGDLLLYGQKANFG